MAVIDGLKFGDYCFSPGGPPFFIGAVKSPRLSKIEYVKYFLDIGGDLCSIASSIIVDYGCPHVANVETRVGSCPLLQKRKY